MLEIGGAAQGDVVGYVTALDVPFEVLDPPELRTLLRDLAARYAAAAAELPY